MLKGGYQIINLENRNHTLDVGMVYEGIYDKIEGTRKSILLSGIQIGGREYHDVYVEPIPDGSNYVMSFLDSVNNNVVKCTVSDVDVVKFTTESIGGGSSIEIVDIEFGDRFIDDQGDFIRVSNSVVPKVGAFYRITDTQGCVVAGFVCGSTDETTRFLMACGVPHNNYQDFTLGMFVFDMYSSNMYCATEL